METRLFTQSDKVSMEQAVQALEKSWTTLGKPYSAAISAFCL